MCCGIVAVIESGPALGEQRAFGMVDRHGHRWRCLITDRVLSDAIAKEAYLLGSPSCPGPESLRNQGCVYALNVALCVGNVAHSFGVEGRDWATSFIPRHPCRPVSKKPEVEATTRRTPSLTAWSSFLWQQLAFSTIILFHRAAWLGGLRRCGKITNITAFFEFVLVLVVQGALVILVALLWASRR
jgi:hypothetical protein